MVGRQPAALTRRATLGLLSAFAAATPAAASTAAARRTLRVRDDVEGRPINPFVFGSNEIGAMDGGALSAELDAAAGVSFRRLGGNLMTTYDWATNASNAGKDWRQANGHFLPDALRLPAGKRARPLAVIETMHEASLAMGAKSLVTLPLAGFVAADADGPVAPADAAPSRRFKPVVWDRSTPAEAKIDPAVCDVSQLLARIVAKYGAAGSARGVHAYSLDNEPGLWRETHPLVVRRKPTIQRLIKRSIAAAKVVKAIDPAALVFGPASWGASEFATFQNAPDWSRYADHGSFLAAYLDAFRIASDKAGMRLLDALDIHWYPFSRRGDLLRTEDPALAQTLLDAPRSLSEGGFVEDSWVPDVLRPGDREKLGLPLLPSLRATVERWYPGTEIAITEFNFGGAGQVASGLALADALGRFAAEGVASACHWGSLAGFVGEAYRLYRSGAGFGGRIAAVETDAGPGVTAYAARGERRLVLVVINKSEAPAAFDLAFAGAAGGYGFASGAGFDATRRVADGAAEAPERTPNGFRLALPPRAARRYEFG
ncbi:glycoside hydrolase family 44 protein [Methylopila sp. M107]|uniref:glycoside hydrolase family 44 protein n=1 Tax=Methylopila sp. M107 TaxID=1101190 RepID=UPI00037DF21E|nr:glycoside hydrolase family 44 protein [Methylopila sp. M107]